MAIPSGQNAVVRGISLADVGKAAGANSMMRELGGVFGIAVVVAVFGAAGEHRLGGRVRRRVRARGGRRGRSLGGRCFDRHRAAADEAQVRIQTETDCQPLEPQPALEGARS